MRHLPLPLPPRPPRRGRAAVAAALAALVALVGAGACAPGLPAPGRLDAAAATVEVPARFHGHHVFVRARLAGTDSAWLLLDSGAQLSVLDARTAASLGIVPTGTATVGGTGGDSLRGGVTPPVGIQLPGTAAYERQVPVVDLSGIEPLLGHRVQGILGADLFERFVVEVDPARGRVRLHDAGAFDAPAAARRVPLRVERGLPYADAAVELPDGRRLTGRFLVDLGSSAALTVVPGVVAREGLASMPGPTIPGHVAGIGGEARSVIVRLRALELGGLRLGGPTAQLALDEGAVRESGGRTGVIGGEVLSRFAVTLDYRRGAMYLEPNARLARPFLANAAGMGIVAEGPHFRRHRVWYVDEGSPAAAAGLRAGDEIEAVNGEPAARLDLPTMRAFTTGERGERVVLRVRRDGEALECELLLRQRI